MKAIIYVRKSTDTEDKQLLSLEAQKDEMLVLAEKNNLEVVSTYEESQSAYKTGRPIFNQVVRDFEKGKADVLLVWKFNRIARNLEDGGKIAHMLQNEIIKEIRTYERVYLPSDHAVLIAVELGSANQDSRNISVDVKRGNRKKLNNGEWPNKAPLGYINNKAEKVMELDKERAPFIKKAFEMYSTGNHSVKEIAQTFEARGFKSRRNKSVSVSMIHNALQKTFYHGVMEWAGEFYKGNHKPLVSQKLFLKCEEVRLGYNKPKQQKEKKLHFSMRGIFKCELCGCSVTAEKQKGISYYHCTNGKGICDQKKKFIREDKLEKALIEKLKENKISDTLIELLYDASLERFHNENLTKKSNKKRLQAELEALRDKESLLTDKLLEGVLSNDIYTKKSKELKLNIFEKERQIDTNEVNITKELATFELTKTVFKAFNFNDISFSKMKTEEKHKTLNNLLSNSTLKNENGSKTLILQYKKPFNIVARASNMDMCPALLPD